MDDLFEFSEFVRRFPDEDSCWEEIRVRKYPSGIFCSSCQEITTHYKLRDRPAYSCTHCRHQVFLLSGTIFEKSTTPLRTWFYAMYLLTQTRGSIPIRMLQYELGVTYKTAWRINRTLHQLMEQNDGALLQVPLLGNEQVKKWVFFNTIEIRIAQKKEGKKVTK